MQGHSHQVWSGQVCSACVGTLQLGWGRDGGMLPQKFLEFRGYEIASETILGQTMLLGGLTTRVSHTWISTLSAHCVVQHWFRLPDRSLISQATPGFIDEACETIIIHLEIWKVVGRKTQQRFFAAIYSHLTSFNISPVCLRALHGRPPSNGTTWQCQANHEWGKKWNQTNWTSGYGPDVTLMCAARKKWYIESLDIAAVSCVLASDYTATICI